MYFNQVHKEGFNNATYDVDLTYTTIQSLFLNRILKRNFMTTLSVAFCDNQNNNNNTEIFFSNNGVINEIFMKDRLLWYNYEN